MLSADDLVAIAGVDLARRDACLKVSSIERAGCVVVNGGKASVQKERANVRTGFMTDDYRFDGRAMAHAVDTGAFQPDPFVLLRDLNNSVLWWICKQFRIGGMNLQMTQTFAPSFGAMWEAIQLLEEGVCELMFVGGVQTRDQAAIHRSVECAHFTPEADPSVGGGAVFFVLERAERAAARQHRAYGEIRIAHASSAVPTARFVDAESGDRPVARVPALMTFLNLARVVSEPAVRSASFARTEGSTPVLNYYAFERVI